MFLNQRIALASLLVGPQRSGPNGRFVSTNIIVANWAVGQRVCARLATLVNRRRLNLKYTQTYSQLCREKYLD
jgi:hypothetical protein